MGEFHTKALSQILAKEGISYIVITPNVSEEVKAERTSKLYTGLRPAKRIGEETLITYRPR
jgi:hypothetical protein